jgi:hypothetical protein
MGGFMMIELINRRQQQILVHSYLYYQLDTNLISDFTYDMWCKELAQLKITHPEEFSRSLHADGFKDFDGSSGFDLPFATPKIQAIGNALIRYHKQGVGGGV